MRGAAFAAALALAFTFAACRREQPNTGAIHIDPALESLVPSDTVFILGADLEAIRRTGTYQKNSALLDLPRLDEFARQTGVDPRKDLSAILSVSNGKGGALLARGNFTPADLERRLKKQGASVIDYQGVKLFGDERNAVAFLSSRTAAAGSTSILKSIVDTRGRQGMPPALAARIRSIPGGSQLWAAFIGGVQGLNFTIPANSNLGGIMRAFKGMDSATLGVDVRNGFDLNAEALCNTANDARHLHDALKGIVGLGRLSTPDNRPELLKLYDLIKVDQNQTQVLVTARIPPDLVDKFLSLWLKPSKSR